MENKADSEEVEFNITQEKKNKAPEKRIDSQEKLGEHKKKMSILDILKLVSPGTNLRLAIEDIARMGHGALIVIHSKELDNLLEGGFRVNCRFTHQRLVELCKMDGAVILSEDLKKILWANTLLVPNREIFTNETGTRHKAAERTAKQTNSLAIAISEKRKKVTLYYGNLVYVLRSSEELLRRATETLQILEKQREIFDGLLTNLNVLEVTNLVVARDVCSILQRIEMMMKIQDIIQRYVLELGKEGRIINMRLKELLKNIEKEETLIIKDYANIRPQKIKQTFVSLSFDSLLDLEGIARIIFNTGEEEQISGRGYRLLEKTSLNSSEAKALFLNFKNINEVFNAPKEELIKILKNDGRADNFKKELENLKEQIIIGKKI